LRLGKATGAALTTGMVLLGCGSAKQPPNTTGISPTLAVQTRPIGSGPRFRSPARGPVIGRCRPRLGPRYGVHVELFAANRVVLVPAGIGTQPPRRRFAGRITAARCYGDLVTVEPTGVVLVRPGARPSLTSLFRGWGQALSARRLASFPAAPGARVAVFVDGRRWLGAPDSVPLAQHSEIVLEVGPYVQPHVSYRFPPQT
jgi:hypothetical protein